MRIPLFHLPHGVDDAKDEDGGTHVEAVNHRIGYRSLGGGVGDAQGGEDEREDIAHQRAGVAQEGLYGISQTFL